MALRPTVVLSLLTFALLAGCSDGPSKGDLTPIPGALTIEGTAVSDYIQAVYPTNPATGETLTNPATGDPVCADAEGFECTDPSSNYTFHFMTLPEADGNGYSVFQAGGSIGDRMLTAIAMDGAGMWAGKAMKEADESTMFERFELRMGNFVVATAGSAEGSQAFVATPALSGVVVTGSYKGNNLDIDVQGLPEGIEFVGRFYTEGLSGNLTVGESFPVVAGAQTLVTEQMAVGSYKEFHIHVGTSKIYVYQATL